jgi:tetratricopeptide (TPR) repeat protein
LRALRGLVLHEIGDYTWALEDLLPAAVKDPDNLEVQFAIGDALLSLNRVEESRPYLLRAQQQPGRKNAALSSYCFTYVYRPEGLATRQARDCTAELVKHAPSDPMHWFWRYQVLEAVRDERWVEAAGQFMLRADPDNAWQQSVKKDMLANGLKQAAPGDAKEAKP